MKGRKGKKGEGRGGKSPTLRCYGAPEHRGRYTQIFGSPNLLPTTDVLQAMACKPQHWDRRQTENTSPIFTLRSVIDYHNKRGSTVKGAC